MSRRGPLHMTGSHHHPGLHPGFGLGPGLRQGSGLRRVVEDRHVAMEAASGADTEEMGLWT